MGKIDIQNIADFLKENFDDILIAYIFGSAKDGFVGKYSDVDIALFLKKTADPLLQLSIASELEDRLKNSIDVIVLNKANPILAHEVIKNGSRLFSRSEKMRAFVELRFFKEHLDNSYYLRRRYG